MVTPEQIAAWRRKHGVGADQPPTQALPPVAATPVPTEAASPRPWDVWKELGGDIKSAAAPFTSFLSEILGPRFSMAGPIPQVDVPFVTPAIQGVDPSMAWGVIPQVEVPGVSPALRTGFDYAIRPFDFAAETTAGIVGAQEALQERLGIPNWVWNPDMLNIASDIFTRPETAEMSPGELAGTLVEEFRARPWYEQVGLGIATDPTALLPIGTFAKALRASRVPTSVSSRFVGPGMPPGIRTADRFATPDVRPRQRPWAPGVSPDAAGRPDPVTRPWDVGVAADRPMLALPPGQGQPGGLSAPGGTPNGTTPPSPPAQTAGAAGGVDRAEVLQEEAMF